MKHGVRSCLIMQHKPYIVELSFMETQKSHDSTNEGQSLTTEGPPQTNIYMYVCDGTALVSALDFFNSPQFERVPYSSSHPQTVLLRKAKAEAL